MIINCSYSIIYTCSIVKNNCTQCTKMNFKKIINNSYFDLSRSTEHKTASLISE